MKLLYLSCHQTLEYDELILFNELGIDCFSLGVYARPSDTGDNVRPGVPLEFHPELFAIVEENKKAAAEKGLTDLKEDIDQRLIDWADVIYCQHIVDWLSFNWMKMIGKKIIWRSIGQSTLNVENLLIPLRATGLKIVRYSPREKTIPNYQGEDAMIRFYKDPAEWVHWTGEDKTVLTVGQSMKDRDGACNWSFFEEVTRPFSRAVYGNPSKVGDPLYKGKPVFENLKQLYRSHRVYFYTGTYPASYTLNFIEALMTGIPVVALGPRLGNSPHEVGQNTYEIPDIINNRINGFYSDNIKELQWFIGRLMDDYPFAMKIGEAGRQTALKLFSKEAIKAQWKEFFHV